MSEHRRVAEAIQASYFEDLKLGAARAIYYKQEKLTPKGVTWRVWWQDKYGDNYVDYVRQRINAKIEAQ